MAIESVTPTAGKSQQTGNSWQESAFRVWVPPVIVALFVVSFIAQLFEIPSGSMENTLLIGDHVMVGRVEWAPAARWAAWLLPYRAPQRDQVVAFKSPVEPGTFLVKRLIGIPGDHIRLIHGVLYRNGERVVEPYVIHQLSYDPGRDEYPDAQLFGQTEAWQQQQWQFFHAGEIVVPPGRYFVMGDNRDISFDSRYWGFVPASDLIGRPLLVYWSVQSSEQEDRPHQSARQRVHAWIATLIHLPARTRWGRTMHRIR